MKTPPIFLILFAFLMGWTTLCAADTGVQEAQAQMQSMLTQISRNNGGEDIEKTRQSNVLIFASLSMPQSSLQALLIDAQKRDIPVIIRGFLPSGFKETVGAIQRTLTDHHQAGMPFMGGVSIDPQRFIQFNVTQVPTFVIVADGHCLLSGDNCTSADYDTLRGNITIPAALHQFVSQGDFSILAKTELDKGAQ